MDNQGERVLLGPFSIAGYSKISSRFAYHPVSRLILIENHRVRVIELFGGQ